MIEQNVSLPVSQMLAAGEFSQPTMSSVDIADLTGKAHKNVLADIRTILGGLKIQPSDFEGTYANAQGKSQPCFHLPKRECLILVSGYDVGLRAKIIDRWMELERSQPTGLVDFSNPSIVLGVITTLQATVTQQTAQLARIGGSDGSLCLTDAAKTLKMPPSQFIRRLSAEHWIYKRVGNASWVGYQDRIASGHLEHREHIYKNSEGQERVSTQVLVTGKGLVKLAEMTAIAA